MKKIILVCSTLAMLLTVVQEEAQTRGRNHQNKHTSKTVIVYDNEGYDYRNNDYYPDNGGKRCGNTPYYDYKYERDLAEAREEFERKKMKAYRKYLKRQRKAARRNRGHYYYEGYGYRN